MALFSDGTILVKTPRCTDPPKYGILWAVDAVTPSDVHWMAGGIEWEDVLCGPSVTGFIDECPPATGFTKPAERGLDFCSADPWVAVGSFDCSTVGRPADEAFEIARMRLLAWEQRTVEEVLWTGISANGPVSPSFAFGNPDCGIEPVDIVPTGSVDAVTAMAVLENALGDAVACGGVIHVPYAYAAYLIDHNLLIERDGSWYTPTGYLVVLGQGYPGSGPGNVAAEQGTTWLFGTGPLVLARSNVIMVPEEVKEGVNRLINNITVRAERFYAVGFSCALFAVRANLSCACC